MTGRHRRLRMIIGITYGVDTDLYYSSEHRQSLITTEYRYKNNTLVHLRIGKNLGIRINGRLRCAFRTNENLQDELFYCKKIGQNRPEPMTRSTFEAKMKRFDKSQTVVEQEIVETYVYRDRDGRYDETRVIIRAKAGSMTAEIDFKDIEQFNNFVRPTWLIPLVP